MGLKALTFLTAGESHGQQLTIMIQNLPAGLELPAADVNEQLRRRQGGYGRGGRQKIERDEIQFVAGVRHGVHAGQPARDGDPEPGLAELGRPDGRREARRVRRRFDRAPQGHAPAARPRRHGRAR